MPGIWYFQHPWRIWKWQQQLVGHLNPFTAPSLICRVWSVMVGRPSRAPAPARAGAARGPVGLARHWGQAAASTSGHGEASDHRTEHAYGYSNGPPTEASDLPYRPWSMDLFGEADTEERKCNEIIGTDHYSWTPNPDLPCTVSMVR